MSVSSKVHPIRDGPQTTTNASTKNSHNLESIKKNSTSIPPIHRENTDPLIVNDQGGSVDQYKLKEIQIDLHNLVKVDDKLV